MRFIRVFLVAMLLLASGAAYAGCERWECRIWPDAANCWIRIGGTSQNFAWADSCNGHCDCMPDTAGTGTLNCSCYCTYNYCYDV